MKKVTFLLSFMMLAYILPAQTIVSTDPENRDGVLEEFTGRNCGFCPDGHVIAENLKTQHGDDFWIINLHAGGFSPSSYPNLNAPHAEAIRSYFGVSSFPNGTVNRHNWGQGVTHGRSTWGAATTSALADPAYCNVGIQARIDPVTRVLTADVEVYYTDNSPVASNYLSVAVLGNGVIGSQAGGGSNYEHNHFLIEMINDNGPWGDEITSTSTGDLFTHTYTWTLPETLPVSNGPDLDAETLEIVAFVTETDHENIINADGGDVVTIMPYDDDASLTSIVFGEQHCYNTVAPSVTVMNGGNNDLTSFDIEYSINGGEVHTHPWTGNIFTLEEETIVLPEITYEVEATNTLDVEIIMTGDENSANDASTHEFDKAPISTETVTLHLQDGLGMPNLSWELMDSEGSILENGDDYAVDSVVNETFTLSDDECFTLHLYANNGNGFFTSGGYFKIVDEDNQEIMRFSGNFGAEAIGKFMTSDLTIGVNELIDIHNEISIYPNPTHGDFSIYFQANETTNVMIRINDITGKMVYASDMGTYTQGGHVIKMNNLNLTNGLYFITIATDNSKIYKKMQILK